MVWYTTREAVKAALDVKETARNNSQVDRAIESASRMIDGHRPGDGFLHRRFYPEIRTMTWDWPNEQTARPWRLWLDANELISITTLTSGDETIAASDYLLRPDDGPPYTYIEIDLSSSAAFSGGDTHQRSISITGLFGFNDDEDPAGTLAAAVSSTTATTVTVSDSATVGVGTIIKANSERMIVTGKSMTTTGQTIGGNLTASAANVTVPVADGTAFHVDETILVESERMLVVDIAGNNLTVKRAWDGSVLAAHNSGTTIYAPRTLTVIRGALGTTAATHSNGATLTKHVVPGLVAELCLGEALNGLLQGMSGYARTSGTGDNQREASGRGLARLRDSARTAYGRKARLRSV